MRKIVAFITIALLSSILVSAQELATRKGNENYEVHKDQKGNL